ncbi:MAG: hypothetical protein KF723_18565 [Rhizobiaceae bacterium]|nr:hypothetical protein [Rhizobiaceae bacterium]
MSTGLLRLPLAAAAIAFAASLAGTAPAEAGNRLKDRIYADSFGNLVVHSRSGYKRIVVGAGHLADELAAYEDAGQSDEPEIVYYEDTETKPAARRCGGAVLLKGRSYMYGLADGYVPTPACDGIR